MSEPDKCIPSTIKSAPIRNDEASLDEKVDAMMARGVTNIEYVSDNESLAAAQNGNYCGAIPGFFDMGRMGGLLGARCMEEDEQAQY
jgi:hypothetical protein